MNLKTAVQPRKSAENAELKGVERQIDLSRSVERARASLHFIFAALAPFCGNHLQDLG